MVAGSAVKKLITGWVGPGVTGGGGAGGGGGTVFLWQPEATTNISAEAKISDALRFVIIL
jgi:phage-related minor tail protein